MANIIKNITLWVNSIINKLFNNIILKAKQVEHKNITINGRLFLAGKGKIIFGDQVKINSSLYSNPIGGQTYTIFVVTKGAKLEIDSNTGISNTTIVCREYIKIGRNVKIGGNTKIYDTDFHSLKYQERINSKTDIANNKPVYIKDDAFIGAHSIILKGVTIGEKSIIGAGSVVTKDVPDREIWGGNPAKFIRKI